jgi:hypothetical protein
LEHTIKELESAARHQDVRKVQLQDKITVLEKDKQRLIDEMPTAYLKTVQKIKAVSKVCTIQ